MPPAQPPIRLTQVYVFEAPVRLWHWVSVLCMVTLIITGYLIGNPIWPRLDGEASDHFIMGYVRFTHFASGYVFAIALLGRIYWAVMGNRYARELFVIPLNSRRWWADVWFQWRWYLTRVPVPRLYIGHDPLAQLVIFILFTVPSVLMILTGFALYGEGAGYESWAGWLFGWIIPLFGQSQAVHSWHHLGMWALLVFIMVHVYAAFHEEFLAPRSILSTMISGYRIFRRRGADP